MRPPCFLATLALFVFASAVRPADWPQWRGPKRDGRCTEKGLLQEWPAEGPPLAWKATGLGKGYSSVAVADGRIFTAGDGPDSSFVHALDLNGRLLWSAKLGAPGERGGYHGPRATPTVDGPRAYTLGQYGDLVCHESATGKEIWRKHLKKDFNGQVGGWGYSESVLVDGGQVICTPGGSKGALLALDKRTGEELWRTADFRDGAEYVSPVLATLGGVKQYVQLTGGTLAGVSPAGRVLWRTDRRGATATIPTPVVVEDAVYVTSGYNVGCNYFKVSREADKFRTEEAYSNKSMVNHHGGVIELDGHIYGYSDGGGWTCQKLSTGEPVWTSKKLGKGAILHADGRFYLRAESGKGTVALIGATPAGYEEKGRFDPPDRAKENSWPHPVIAHGKLYLRDQDTLLCYDVKRK